MTTKDASPALNELPRLKLRELIARHGRELCDDPRRCNALLFEACRGYQREINILLSALDEKIHIDLANAAYAPSSAVIATLVKRLQDRRALREESARWAVESWVAALNQTIVTRAETPKSSYGPAAALTVSNPIPSTPQTTSGASPTATTAATTPNGNRTANTAQLAKPSVPSMLATETLAPARGYWREFWRRFSRNRRAVLSLIIIAGVFMAGIFTETLSPYCHTTNNLRAVDQAPSLAHPFGTDNLGRDLASRMVWGARTAIIVAVSVITLNMTIGLIFGMIAGYFGGKIDSLIMRAADFLFAFPDFLFLMFIAATVRPSVVAALSDYGRSIGLRRGVNCAMDYVAFGDFVVVIGALAFIGWPGLARLVRSLFLSLREREFVESARAMGAGSWRIIARHILPNALPALIVSMAYGMGGAIMAETSLSFIGVGIQPPNASWGTALLENYTFWRTRPYMIIIPGGIIAMVILAFNFLGQGLNEALNPKNTQ